MLKILGLGAIVFAGAGMGILFSSELSKRVKALEKLLLLIDRIKSHLKYAKTPTKEMIGALSRDCALNSLGFISICNELMKKGEKFPEAWKKSLSNPASCLNKRETEMMLDMGRSLGASDADGQISMLELNEAMLRQYLDEAVENRNIKGKLYRTMGILSGAWIAIMLA